MSKLESIHGIFRALGRRKRFWLIPAIAVLLVLGTVIVLVEGSVIAPFLYTLRKDPLAHADDELPKLWEAQLRSTAIPHTGLVPITDTVDDVTNIHPGKKSTVGHRLAALALAATYGRGNIVASGPLFARLEIRGTAAIVHFSGISSGLASRDDKPLTDFEIAGADDAFVPAEAVIRGATIVVSSPQVSHPATVRFGWHETARPNLMNREGWPAYPFRSDGPAWPETLNRSPAK